MVLVRCIPFLVILLVNNCSATVTHRHRISTDKRDQHQVAAHAKGGAHVRNGNLNISNHKKGDSNFNGGSVHVSKKHNLVNEIQGNISSIYPRTLFSAGAPCYGNARVKLHMVHIPKAGGSSLACTFNGGTGALLLALDWLLLSQYPVEQVILDAGDLWITNQRPNSHLLVSFTKIIKCLVIPSI
jgi:hypothetical protein